MSQQGWVTAVTSEPIGTVLVADAAAGATQLSVDYAGDFDPDGGTLQLGAQVLTYTGFDAGAEDADPDIIYISGTTTASATVDDAVQKMTGGLVAIDMNALVSLGDGDVVRVPIPFEQRALWAVGSYEPSVPCTVSDDLTTIEGVYGVQPTIQPEALAGTGLVLDWSGHHRLGLNLTKQGVVLPKGAGGTWDSVMVESPTVGYDPKSGRWAMTYVGYGTLSGAQRAGIGLAYSDDAIAWTKYGTAAVLPHSAVAGAPDENGCSGATWFWENDNNRYGMLYIGLTEPGYELGTKSLCYAHADSLEGPWTRTGAVIVPEGTGWRANAIWHASVPVQRDGKWYVFFNATGADNVERIGFATAPAISGPWTVNDTLSPVLGPTGTGWESHDVGDPSVRRVGDMWLMDYYGHHISPESASDGIAVTTDNAFPGGWTRHPSNPTLEPSAAYDAKYAHKPFCLYKGGVLYHYYTAVAADDTRQIALATEGLPGSVPTTRLISTDATLTGGGDLSADRTLGVETVAEAERIRDVIGAALVAGSNITITVDDAANSITIAAAASSGGELLMQDGVSAPPVPIENEAQTDWLYEG